MSKQVKPGQAKKKAKRICVLVLGMHRSGTSALTRVISLLGAKLPKHLMPANFANETGYWEAVELNIYLDKILRWVEEGRCPGHSITALALRSVLFNLSASNALIATLHCEWAGVRNAQPPSREPGPGFAEMNPRLHRQLPSWLQSVGNNTFQFDAGE